MMNWLHRWGLGLILWLASVGLAPVALAQTLTGPSFACTAAQSTVEQAICANPELSAADREMATLYAAARVSAFGKGPANELPAQRDALKAMRECAKPTGKQSTTECLRREYSARNDDLAIAVLMRAPDLALPVIRKSDPAFAPLLEAVQLWASAPQGVSWSAPEQAGKRTHVLALLKPYMDTLLTGDSTSQGREILADPSGDGITVTHLEDILKSERHFAAFLNVLGPDINDANGPSGNRTLPCAAIVRHPALLAATSSIFGSTMDNFVLGNDCAQTLPPTPALDVLDAGLTKAWPQCDGTIRFAIYRTYRVALDAARLGVAKPDPKAGPQRRRGVTAAEIAAARSELTAYYIAYLDKPRATATAMAGDALTAILATAQECD